MQETDDRVHLKPIFGIRPGVYLAFLYLSIILLILFFTLFYPGIKDPGAVIEFTSEPQGAALRIDDVYAGTSPCSVFVPKGDHVFEVTLPGFMPEKMEIPVKGRVFASAIFPKKIPLDVRLHTENPEKTLALSAAEFAEWTFGGEPTFVWQIPLCLSDGVYRIGPYIDRANVDGILAAALRFAVTQASLRDILRAKFLAAGGGNPPSPFALIRSAAQIIRILDENPNSAAWLADTLLDENLKKELNLSNPDEIIPALAWRQKQVEIITESAWRQNQDAAIEKTKEAEEFSIQRGGMDKGSLPENRIRLGGLLFRGIEEGILVQGNPYPHKVPVDAFLISTTVVPKSVFDDFLNANPQWRQEKVQTLISGKYVTSEYLADYSGYLPRDPEGRNLPMDYKWRNTVSWHAARAFCKWLETKLPPEFDGWEIRLPKESEWEYAAKYVQKGQSPPGGQQSPGITIFDPAGYWEWCEDYYSPLPFFAASCTAIDAVASPERVIRGNSRLNRAGSTGIETRAFLPPDFCSPFVSFRPVIARKNTCPLDRQAD